MSSKSERMKRWENVAATQKIQIPKPQPVMTAEEELEHRKLNRQVQHDLYIARSYDTKARNADSSNHAFKLTLSDWTALMNQPTCAYSGVAFDYNSNMPNSRTMERINPKLGYTVDNTIAVTSAANSEKSRLDAFIKGDVILDEVKLKLLRKAAYQIEKRLKIKG